MKQEIGGIPVNSDTEKMRIKKHRQRARDAGTRDDLSGTEWILILIRHNGRCAYCGQPFESIDHIVPLCNGGGTTASNVLPACIDCNQRKGEAVWL